MDEIERAEYEKDLFRLLDFVVTREIFLRLSHVHNTKKLQGQFQEVFHNLKLDDVYSKWIDCIISTNHLDCITLKCSLTIRSESWWEKYRTNIENRDQIFRNISKGSYFDVPLQ